MKNLNGHPIGHDCADCTAMNEFAAEMLQNQIDSMLENGEEICGCVPAPGAWNNMCGDDLACHDEPPTCGHNRPDQFQLDEAEYDSHGV